MFSKILSLVLSVCMLITSAPFGPAVDEIGDLFESISQKIADSVDGFVESLGQKDKDTSATNNQKEEEFVVTEQASGNWTDYRTAVTANGDYYDIYTAEQLAWVSWYSTQSQTTGSANRFLNKTIRLQADIDLTAHYWIPIGGIKYASSKYSYNNNSYFRGTFDGQGYTITGLNVESNADYRYYGLFGYTNGATIENVGLKNVSVQGALSTTTATYGIGALVSYAQASTIRKCFVRDGSVSTNALSNAGGLVGTFGSSASTVTNCYVQGVSVSNTKSHTYTACGGLVGYMSNASAAINYSYFAGTLTSKNTTTGKFMGGVVGRIYTGKGKIVNSYTISDYEVYGDDSTAPGTNSGDAPVAGTLKTYGYPNSAAGSTLNAADPSKPVYYMDINSAKNAGYPVFVEEFAYKALIDKVNEAQSFYDNRGSLPGWGGIVYHELSTATALQTAITNANNFMAGTASGTVDSHIAALQSAMDALTAASNKYVNGNYAPTISVSAPSVISLSGSTLSATVTLTSNYQLSSFNITSTNGPDSFAFSHVATEQSGNSWVYTCTVSGTVSNPTLGGKVIYTVSATANGKTTTGTASSVYAGSPPEPKSTKINVSVTYPGWSTPTATFYVNGLHAYNSGNSGTLSASASTSSTATVSTSPKMIGTFYHDTNNSNTLTNTTDTSNVSFRYVTPSYTGSNAYQIQIRRASVSANPSAYLTAIAKYDLSKSGVDRSFNGLNVTPSGTGQEVTYTFFYGEEVHLDGRNWNIGLNTNFSIQFTNVNTTQLWNLYNSEANTFKRVDYADFYSANDSEAWDTYMSAYLNAQTVLKGGVPQTTIDNAYTQLVDAIKGLKGKINYNKNGGAGTVTTPQYPAIYSDVTAVSTAVQAPTYTFATVTLSSYSGLTKVGYTCKGWATSSTATTGFSTTTMNATRATAAFTLYAVWEKKNRVLFDINDGTSNVNLFSFDGLSKTVNGVTYTYNPSDGTITLNGTATTAPKFFEVPFTVVSGEKYRYTLDYISGSVQNGCAVVELLEHATDTPRLNLDLSNADSSKTVTIADADVPKVNRLNFRGYWNSSGTGLIFTNYKFKFKMEKASASTAQTPPGMYVAPNSTYGTLPTPTRAGYAFKGWYTAKTGGTKIESSSTITADTTVYAQWTASTYTISFNGNGNTGGSTASMSMTYGTAKNLTANGFTKTGYTFAGWNTKADGTGDSYTNKQSVNNLTATNGATVTLYAQWTLNQFYLNIKGLLDGVESANIGSYGTVDIYVNGVQVADDVIDYYTKHPYGSTYEIKDIKVATGKTFVQSGSNALSGTIDVTSGEKTVILKFTTNTYTISFNGNGNTGGSTASMSMTYGTAKNLTANGFTKTGYTFAGWNTKADGTGTGYTNQQSVNNLTATNGATVTLYAQWTAKAVTITLDRVGGTGGTASVTATYGSNLPNITVPTKAGYTFAGYFADDRTTSLASEIIYNSSSSYARVNFKKDGNDWNLTTDGDKGRHLTAVIIFVDPSRTNAPQIQFNDVNLDNSMYQVEEITNGWKYTVDFDITEEMVTAKGSTLYNTNFRFIDFSCVPTSDTVITVSSATLGGNMYYDAEGKGVLVSDFETNDTLYARWTGNTYTIKFNGNGNTGGSTAQMSMTYGAAKELTANGFTKTGYTFNGWNTVADGTGDSYTDKQSVNNLTATDGATVTLYAQWTANTYTVTFDANGGTCDTESITVAYQTPYGELPTATKTGYIFTGWYASTTSTTQILPTTKFTITSDQILYAKWTPITYTIRYLPNGGSGSAAADEICNYDELHTLSRTNYNRTGYRFVGWNTKADGTGDFYEYGAQVKNLTDVDGEIVILYAVWEALSYTARFKLNGGEYVEITSKTVTYDSPYGELPIPTRKGYTFTGWYTSSSSSGVLITEETIVSRTVDHDLYAHWKVTDGYDLMATSPDAYMTVSIGEEAATLEGDIYQIELPAGTKVTITANVNNGETRKFMCWRDDRMRIVSREEKYTFVLEADKKIEAVYSEEANSEYYTVVFVDSILKMVVDIQRVVKGGSATEPTITTENAGYVFDKWDTDTTQVNENLIVNAIYRPRNNIHTIKIVIGDTESESKYYYNTPVTVAITDDQIPEGQNFAGWTFDGKTIASYDREFRFYVYKDLTVTAVFATAETEEKPTVVLTTTIKEQTATTYKAEFMVTRTVPENYVFVSSGLLLTQSAEYGTNEKLTFESYSVDEQTAIRLYRTVHTTNDGQYQLTVKTSAGKTFYARGFIVYINTDNEIVTEYTDVVTVTNA